MLRVCTHQERKSTSISIVLYLFKNSIYKKKKTVFHNEEKHFTKSRRFSKLLLSRNCIFLYTIFRTYVTLVSRKILPIFRNNSRATIYDNKRIKEIRTRSWHRQVSTTFLLLSNYRYIYVSIVSRRIRIYTSLRCAILLCPMCAQLPWETVIKFFNKTSQYANGAE